MRQAQAMSSSAMGQMMLTKRRLRYEPMQFAGTRISMPISDMNSSACIHLRQREDSLPPCHMSETAAVATQVLPGGPSCARRYAHAVYTRDRSETLVQAHGHLELVPHPRLLPMPSEPSDQPQ
eukprot:2341408-Prymnesium_polylepis.1